MKNLRVTRKSNLATVLKSTLLAKMYEQVKILNDIRTPTIEKPRVKKDQEDTDGSMDCGYLLLDLSLSLLYLLYLFLSLYLRFIVK